jgi:hypothetical protein
MFVLAFLLAGMTLIKVLTILIWSLAALIANRSGGENALGASSQPAPFKVVAAPAQPA